MMEDHKKRCPIRLAILSTAPMQTIVLMHHKKDYVRKNSSPTTAALRFIPIRDLFFEKASPGYVKPKSKLFCSSIKFVWQQVR
eukprot:scaffold4515_cov124-Skeletonema_dohrnii-CCMP3373.AAC.4